MQKHTDSLLIIDNEKLYKVFGDLSIFEAFPKADDVLSTAVKGIAEIITRHGFINVDFADVKTVMKNSGMALMGSGSASGEGRAVRAVEEAFLSPLLNDVDLGSAQNVLVNITSGKEKGLSMIELNQIMVYIKEYTGGVSNFKRGVVCNPAIGDAIHVTIVATGLDMILPHLPQFKEDQVESVVLGGHVLPSMEPQEEQLSAPKSYGVFKIGNSDHTFHVQNPTPSFSNTNTNTNSTHTLKKGKPALILDPDEKIGYYETTPAYIRQKMKIEDVQKSEGEPCAIKIEERDGKQHLSSENSYIHQRQD
jgi:cell division protein FtsZ